METAKQHFQQSHVLVPVFFLVTGALTLIAAGCTYTKNNLHHIAKPCFIAGIVMAVLSIIHSLAMIFVLPYVNKLCTHMIEWKRQTPSVTVTVEDGLSICSEEVLAADGDGIAFGPKRRRKTSKDTLCELKEKKDGHRESDVQRATHGSLDSQSQQSRKDSTSRRLSRSSKINFGRQSMDLGEKDESENLERAAEVNTG